MYKQYIIQFNLAGDSQIRYEHIESHTSTSEPVLRAKLTKKLKGKYPEYQVNGGLERYIQNKKDLFLKEAGDLFDWQGKFHEMTK
jgi:hypothetical protein